MSRTRTNGQDKAAAIPEGDGWLSTLFDRNRAWADAKTRNDPGFFRRLVGQQRPRYFWIGCSDSRVPATEIVDLDPGEMFVHRNVANLAIAADPNFSAALQFAVDVLNVHHIIVVGHYGCGGIHAAMENETDDAIGHWLAPVRQLHRRHPCKVNTDGAAAEALCERNVVAQVDALSVNPLVRAAWAREAPLSLHGWVYRIGDGLLKSLCRRVHGGGLAVEPVIDGTG
ncbi:MULTISPECIES: carbonic anhydrase [Sphingomonadaceae]|uniref:carbonic anhydrase n=1 Tax=Sphingomonadales TaxID=204457 RepID=UPI0007702377|nr:carbonic anhydrase [Sphingobium sp. TKS]AMK23053.1 carbonic anhydrase [Sphingobium sp. TKS]MCF8707834.1 carbonic anhydrase [Rhizorhapis sp. SPR117]